MVCGRRCRTEWQAVATQSVGTCVFVASAVPRYLGRRQNQNQTAFSQAVCAFSTHKCQICDADAPSSSCGLCVLRAPLPRSAMANCCQSSLGAHSLQRFEPCVCARSQGSGKGFHSFSNIIAPQAGANKAVQTQIGMRNTKSVAKVAVHERVNIQRFEHHNSGASLKAVAITLKIRH